MPTNGRIATQTTPAIPRQHAVAGMQEMQQAIALTLSPSIGPIQGTQSPAISSGPKQRQKANHNTSSPTTRSTQVKTIFSERISSKNAFLLCAPIFNSDNVN